MHHFKTSTTTIMTDAEKIQQLENEKAALLTDIKQIKTTVLFVTNGLNISQNGVFPPKINVSVFDPGTSVVIVESLGMINRIAVCDCIVVVRIKNVISRKPRSTIGVRSTLIPLCKYFLPLLFGEVFISAIKIIYG